MRKAIASTIAALEAHRIELGHRSITSLFDGDPGRFSMFSTRWDDILFDYSRNGVDSVTLALLLQLARETGLEDRRAALFSGVKVNLTENRAAMHMALRGAHDDVYPIDGKNVMPEVIRAREKFLAFVERVRDKSLCGATGHAFSDVVNIGIGGSDLGPAMAMRALAPFSEAGPRIHFVSNVDGADIGDTMRSLDPARTLFIVSSKTFTTQETMTNAASARAVVAGALGEAAVGSHFVAVSTRTELADAFGVLPDRVFGFWDWVGGRFSMWSAIGLALAIGVGRTHFEAFLQGARHADMHFLHSPLQDNIPVLMGLIGVWHRNIWGYGSQAVIPYDQRLARFPAYLQQLEMESNGKSVRRGGEPVDMATAPVVWGEPGTNGQHAFFQMLHQGTEPTPVDFLIAAEPVAADDHHHDLLLANCLAQSEALMRGRSLREVEALMRDQGLKQNQMRTLAPHKVFPGSRPSSTLLYRRLDPWTLGRLIALYEHKTFVQSVIWDVNAFDQWGVELGKEMCNALLPAVSGDNGELANLHPATAGLIAHRRALKAQV